MSAKVAVKKTVKKKPVKKTAPKSRASKAVKADERVLVLRTCDANLKSHRGFQWPESGPVACPDWKNTAECGNGLHGLLWGEGNGQLLNWDEEAKWLVVSVLASEVVKIDSEKVKFPRGEVVFCGDRLGATAYLVERLTKSASVVGALITAGDRGTATAGDGGTATAGDWGTATAGDGGTATAGDRGTATAGNGGTATAGDRGTLQLSFYDNAACRKRIVTLYVGENGIEKNVKYKLNEKNEPVKA